MHCHDRRERTGCTVYFRSGVSLTAKSDDINYSIRVFQLQYQSLAASGLEAFSSRPHARPQRPQPSSSSRPSRPTRSPRIRTRLLRVLPPSHSTVLKPRALRTLCPPRPRLTQCALLLSLSLLFQLSPSSSSPRLTLLVLIFVLGWKTAASNRRSSTVSTLNLLRILLFMSSTFLSISIFSSRRRRHYHLRHCRCRCRRCHPFARCRNDRKLNRRRSRLDSLITKPISHKFRVFMY